MEENTSKKSKQIPPPLDLSVRSNVKTNYVYDKLTTLAIVATSPHLQSSQHTSDIKRSQSWSSFAYHLDSSQPAHLGVPYDLTSSGGTLDQSYSPIAFDQTDCLCVSSPSTPAQCDEQNEISRFDWTVDDSFAVYMLSYMASQHRDARHSNESHGNEIHEDHNNNKGKRPMNAFMFYAKQMRPQFVLDNPGLDNRSISKLLGEKWKSMLDCEKEIYIHQTRAMAEEQKRLHPDCWKRKRSSSVTNDA